MKKLKLVKEKIRGGYAYKIFEDTLLLCSRKSKNEYVACYVVYQEIRKDSNTTKWEYSAPFFFSRIDLIGKGDSRYFNSDGWASIRYGLAELEPLG